MSSLRKRMQRRKKAAGKSVYCLHTWPTGKVTSLMVRSGMQRRGKLTGKLVYISYLLAYWECDVTQAKDAKTREIGGKQVRSRVQWLLHFFRNSTFFTCFWFGLEILRLVSKKVFFWNIERFLSYLTFYPSQKVAPLPPSWKKLGVQGIKRSGILHGFQKCAEVSSLAKGKKVVTENLNF